MNSMEHIKDEERQCELLRDYVAYVLTSARGLHLEPQSYGTMRMFDAMEKGLSLLREIGLKDEAMEEALIEVRADRWRAGNDPEGFARAIDDSILQLVNLSIKES